MSPEVMIRHSVDDKFIGRGGCVRLEATATSYMPTFPNLKVGWGRGGGEEGEARVGRIKTRSMSY